MRRIAVAVPILIFACLCAFAGQSSMRLRSMGGLGIAVNDQRHPSVSNPAVLYFIGGESLFMLDSSYNDSFLPNSGETFPTYPGSSLNGTFMGRRISFSIGFDYSVQSVGIGEGVKYYNVFQTSEIRLDFAAGFGNLGAGIEVYGGSVKQRVNVPINQRTAFSDFIIQTFLSPYDRKGDSEYLQINLGLMYGRNGLSFGLVFNDILDNQGSKTALTWNSFIDGTGFGLYYAMDEYGRRGSLNHFGFCVGFEMSNVFDKDGRMIHAGLELSYMLLKDYGFYARTGFQGYTKDFSQGVHSVGVGAKLNGVELCLNFRLPFGVYKGSDDDRFTVELAASFSI